MATLRKRTSKTGIETFKIQFLLNGIFRVLSLGRSYSQTDAEEVKRLVEKLVENIKDGTEIDRKTRMTLETIPKDLRERLESCELLEPSKRRTAFDLWEEFLGESDERKDSTILTYEISQKRFFRFFKPDTDPDEITVKDGKDFRSWLVKEGYKEATVAATIAKTRTVFSWGVKREYIRKNIFLEVRRGSYENKDREYFITPEDYLALLEACPSQEWRVFISLMRIGGLRWGETVALKWADINFEKGVMKVDSPKTEHHAGHEWRLVPIFPELREELDKLDEMAETGEIYVLNAIHGESCTNLAKQFKHIIFQAGLEVWPRIFHNLRGSRSNELFRRFSIFDASNWMGQSAKVAQHYYINSRNPELIREATNYQTIQAHPKSENPEMSAYSGPIWA